MVTIIPVDRFSKILDIVIEMVDAGIQVAPYLQSLAKAFHDNTMPSEADLDNLKKQEMALDELLNASIPDDPTGDTYA